MGIPWENYSGASLYTAVKSLFTFSVLLVLISGCGNRFDTPETATEIALPGIPPIPPSRTLMTKLVPDEFHELDFMELHGCLLQTTLGKFQSKLGRYASASQQLLLNLEYLRLAPECIKYKNRVGKLELARYLREQQGLKHRQLPSLIFNATLANTEFQHFWQGTNRHSSMAGQAKLSLAALTGIKYSVRQWLNGDYRASNLEFEIQLSEVAKTQNDAPQLIELRQVVYELEALLSGALSLPYRRWSTHRNQHFEQLQQPAPVFGSL